MVDLYYERLYAPSAMDGKYLDLVEVYQRAFAAAPWNEVTKCPDPEVGASRACPNGFSPLEIGTGCGDCGQAPEEVAYTRQEVLERFEKAGQGDEQAHWYIEENIERNPALCVLARVIDFETIATQEYEGNPKMAKWILERFDSNREVVWLDEIFADTRVRPSGNLANFGAMCARLATEKTPTVALRTVNPKIVSAAQRDFRGKGHDSIKIHDPSLDPEIPDNRKLIVIQAAA